MHTRVKDRRGRVWEQEKQRCKKQTKTRQLLIDKGTGSVLSGSISLPGELRSLKGGSGRK